MVRDGWRRVVFLTWDTLYLLVWSQVLFFPVSTAAKQGILPHPPIFSAIKKSIAGTRSSTIAKKKPRGGDVFCSGSEEKVFKKKEGGTLTSSQKNDSCTGKCHIVLLNIIYNRVQILRILLFFLDEIRPQWESFFTYAGKPCRCKEM